MAQRRPMNRPYVRGPVLFPAFFLLLFALPTCRCSFEPYQLNGGLVAAVAGRDFCVVASDTRLMDGGYEIYTRRHVTSRLWSVHSGRADSGDQGWLQPDGSIRLPGSGNQQEQEGNLHVGLLPPVCVASAGCSADCEALKRLVRLEARASDYWNTDLHVSNIASLVSQVLYQRRGFPYYAFCVVAGMHPQDLGEGGAAFVYDAIGSFEQVAVATAGTGRELLQPILDRLFSTGLSFENDSKAIEIAKAGTATTMPAVVNTQVDCSLEEAVARLIRGYRSVSERDIGVGDNVVLCVMERIQQPDGNKKQTECRVLSVPLKQH